MESLYLTVTDVAKLPFFKHRIAHFRDELNFYTSLLCLPVLLRWRNRCCPGPFCTVYGQYGLSGEIAQRSFCRFRLAVVTQSRKKSRWQKRKKKKKERHVSGHDVAKKIKHPLLSSFSPLGRSWLRREARHLGVAWLDAKDFTQFQLHLQNSTRTCWNRLTSKAVDYIWQNMDHIRQWCAK